MEIIRGLYNLRAGHRGCVLAAGNFDGVHRGHQALLARLREHAQRLGMPATVQSFRPTAAAWFCPEQAPPLCLPLRDTVELLRDAGVERWLRLRFDARFAEFPAERYIDEVLVQRLGVRALVVGYDFRFGAGRSGNIAMLRAAGEQYGFTVDEVARVDDGAERVSSTRLRAALGKGDLAEVERLLGRAYALSGIVRRGRGIGRDLNAPTANLTFRDRIALRHGVYAVWMETGDARLPGVANFGTRPTLGASRPLLEAHALEPFAKDGFSLYGRQLRVVFHRFLRDERRFASVDALAEQISADKAAARMALDLDT